MIHLNAHPVRVMEAWTRDIAGPPVVSDGQHNRRCAVVTVFVAAPEESLLPGEPVEISDDYG